MTPPACLAVHCANYLPVMNLIFALVKAQSLLFWHLSESVSRLSSFAKRPNHNSPRIFYDHLSRAHLSASDDHFPSASDHHLPRSDTEESDDQTWRNKSGIVELPHCDPPSWIQLLLHTTLSADRFVCTIIFRQTCEIWGC